VNGALGGVSRRKLMARGAGVIAAVVSALVGVPIIGYLLEPTIGEREPVVWRRVAALADIPTGEPTAYYVAFPQAGPPGTPPLLTLVWVYKLADGALFTLSASCTHMQCLVHWQPDLHQYLCPCHGGLYVADGTNVGGPPPRPLRPYPHVIQAGDVYVANLVDGQPV
jgi:menaquinol-cytochrome c reductase iron-sulfur subunit